ADPGSPVSSDVPRDFATARRMAYQSDVGQVQGSDEGSEVVGVAVHVVACRCLTRPAMSPSVVGDDPKPVLGQEQHLSVPGIRAEGPAVGEHNGGALSPVLVVDVRPVTGRDVAHGGTPLVELSRRSCGTAGSIASGRLPSPGTWPDRGDPSQAGARGSS